MEHAKKFALVPEHLVSKHTVSDQDLSDLDANMLSILKSSLDEHEKVRQYYTLLQKKINMEEYNPPWKTSPQEESNEQVVEPKKEEDSYEAVILNSVPQPMRKEALKALNIMKEHSNILKWNDKGELIVKDKLISKTNIADLFNLMFNIKKKKTHIAGIGEFLEALNEMNVPKHYIKNKYISINTTPSKNVKSPVRNWLKY